MDRVGQCLGLRRAALAQPVDHLLGEQGIAARADRDLLGELGLRARVRHQRPDELSRLGGPKRLERDRGRVEPAAAPASAAVEQLVARQADDQHRASHPARQVLDQVEHPLVGPVDVLDGEDHRLAPCRRLDQGADCREEPVAHLLRIVGLERVRHALPGRLDPEGSAERRRDSLRRLLGVGGFDQSRDPALQLAPGELAGIGVDDLEGPANHLAEGPVGQPGAIGGAVAELDRGRAIALAHPHRQLPQQPGLADPCLAQCGDQMRALLANHPIEQRDEQLRLVLAADQRRRAARGTGAVTANHGPDRLPGGHGLGLALELERLELDVLDRGAGEPVGELADDHSSRLCGRLQPRRHVDRVTDHRVAVADPAGQHLPGVDPDPQREARPDRGGDPLVDLGHRAQHRQPGPNRALGIVLMRHRRSEDAHHVVADVLVDRPAVAFDLGPETLQCPIDHRLHPLRVEALGNRGVAGEVREHHGRLAALLGRRLLGCRRDARRRAGRGELGAARDAEPRPGGVLRPAGRTLGGQRRAAGHAEAGALGVFGAAARAGHGPRIRSVPGLRAPRPWPSARRACRYPAPSAN